MFKNPGNYKKIYIACGYTDLRYGVDGLSCLVQEAFNLNPYDEGTLFLFCGRKSDRIKGLLWEGDGFLLLYKRLSNGRFQWPRSSSEMKQMTSEQFQWLTTGLTIEPTIHKSRITQNRQKFFPQNSN